jgi:hypothetical protein
MNQPPVMKRREAYSYPIAIVAPLAVAQLNEHSNGPESVAEAPPAGVTAATSVQLVVFKVSTSSSVPVA